MPNATNTANIVCPRCHKTNRAPSTRRDEEPRCGACKSPLFGLGPIALDDGSFWAAWCGPCRLMAPAFERAAADWEGRVRFAKVDTDANPGVSQRFRIQSIPTMILFQGGRELARTSGALSADQIKKWHASQHAA